MRDRVALGYRSEYTFYTELAGQVSIPIPHSYHCAIERDGADFVLLLDDMAPAVQGDQIGGCSADEAILAVEALAGLHGPTWCDHRWAGHPGMVMAKPDRDAAAGMGEVARMAAEVTAERLGDRMSPADRDTLFDALSLVTPWLLAEPDRFAVLHGDYRADNLLFDPDRRHVTVVDWQTLGVGLPARDLAYFTATSLLPELRATIEPDLVERYHRKLTAHGVTGYELESCWRDYRLGVLQAPLITALGFAFAAATERGDEMVLAMLQRGCRAIRELGTLGLLDD